MMSEDFSSAKISSVVSEMHGMEIWLKSVSSGKSYESVSAIEVAVSRRCPLKKF